MKKLFRAVIAVLTVCLALTCFAACGNKSSGKDGKNGKLAAVDESSISLVVRTDGVLLSWGAVENAETYVVKCNGVTFETDDLTINYERVPGFTLPSDRVFNVSIYAKADGYTNSKAVTYTHTAEGIDLVSPSIKSFEDGVISWSSVTGVAGYKVTVNGSVVVEAQQGTSFDIGNYTGVAAGTSFRFDVSAVSNNSVYRRESAKTSVMVDASRTKLSLLPITEFTVENGVLKWQKNGAARAYKIVDIRQTVAATVTDAYYDMNDHLMVCGVYPVSSSDIIGDAETGEPAAIKYLDGAGTAASPYLIKSAFDLRAIDYYEAQYAEKLKTEPNAQPNVYRIENDINYNAVAALEEESNIYTLTCPFYGTLDGNNKKLSNLRVRYDGGYWALFELIVKGAVVKNITFDNVDIYNEIKFGSGGNPLPNGTSIATVAHDNYGTIQGVIIRNVLYIAKGGDISGIATYNHKGATIIGCSLMGDVEFRQEDTGVYSQGCFEMAGITVENSGSVRSCMVRSLILRGSESSYEIKNDQNQVTDYGHFNNVRMAAGIASYNRAGGVLTDNSYGTVDMICMVDDVKNLSFGGIVAQDAGEVSGSAVGTLTWSSTQTVGATVDRDTGISTNRVGKIRGYRG